MNGEGLFSNPEQNDWTLAEIITDHLINEFGYAGLTVSDLMQYEGEKSGQLFIHSAAEFQKKVITELQLDHSILDEIWADFLYTFPGADKVDLVPATFPSDIISPQEEMEMRRKLVRFHFDQTAIPDLDAGSFDQFHDFREKVIEAALNTNFDFANQKDTEFDDPREQVDSPNFDEKIEGRVPEIKNVHPGKKMFALFLKRDSTGNSMADILFSAMDFSSSYLFVTDEEQNRLLTQYVFEHPEILHYYLLSHIIAEQGKLIEDLQSQIYDVVVAKGNEVESQRKAINKEAQLIFFQLLSEATSQGNEITIARIFRDNYDQASKTKGTLPEKLNPDNPESMENRLGTETSVMNTEIRLDQTTQTLIFTTESSAMDYVTHEDGKRVLETHNMPKNYYVKKDENGELLFGEDNESGTQWTTHLDNAFYGSLMKSLQFLPREIVKNFGFQEAEKIGQKALKAARQFHSLPDFLKLMSILNGPGLEYEMWSGQTYSPMLREDEKSAHYSQN